MQNVPVTSPLSIVRLLQLGIVALFALSRIGMAYPKMVEFIKGALYRTQFSENTYQLDQLSEEENSLL